MSTPRCPKSTILALIAAAGRNKLAGEYGAPMRVQQRFYDAYQRQLERVAQKCPAYDTTSQRFQTQLDERAAAWIASRPVRGPGRDW